MLVPLPYLGRKKDDNRRICYLYWDLGKNEVVRRYTWGLTEGPRTKADGGPFGRVVWLDSIILRVPRPAQTQSIPPEVGPEVASFKPMGTNTKQPRLLSDLSAEERQVLFGGDPRTNPARPHQMPINERTNRRYCRGQLKRHRRGYSQPKKHNH